MPESEFRELRDLVIRLDSNMVHLNNKIDGFIAQSNSQAKHYDDQFKRFDDRLRAVERNIWMGLGAVAIGSWLINYYT